MAKLVINESSIARMKAIAELSRTLSVSMADASALYDLEAQRAENQRAVKHARAVERYKNECAAGTQIAIVGKLKAAIEADYTGLVMARKAGNKDRMMVNAVAYKIASAAHRSGTWTAKAATIELLSGVYKAANK